MAGLTAAICCFIEILPLFIRHLIYRLSKGGQRLIYIANGLALKTWKFVKQVARAIFSNGLAMVFSLVGGALGMLIPIPVVNLIVSGLLSTIGFILGQYIAGLPSNICRYWKQKKRRSLMTVRYQTLENNDYQVNP